MLSSKKGHDLVFRKSIPNVVFILQKEVSKYQEIYIPGQMLVFNKGVDPVIVSKEHINVDACWAANRWVNVLSGGILFLPVKKGLNKQRPTGKREGSFYRQPITMNLFPCPKTIPSQQEQDLLHPLFHNKNEVLHYRGYYKVKLFSSAEFSERIAGTGKIFL